MWCEYMYYYPCCLGELSRKELSKKLPPLENIIIKNISIIDISGSENILKIELDIPKLLDNIPEKWKKPNYNGICIGISFYNITDIFIEKKQDFNHSNIKIDKIDNTYQVEINGAICMHFKTRTRGLIRYVKGMRK